jgi:hypothetical protein
MGQIFQYLQTLTDHVMAFFALDMGNKTHSTGIALLARVIQTLLHRQRRVNHGIPQSNQTGC